MRESDEEGNGTLRQDISSPVAPYKEHFGRGPTRCRTYLPPPTS